MSKKIVTFNQKVTYPAVIFSNGVNGWQVNMPSFDISTTASTKEEAVKIAAIELKNYLEKNCLGNEFLPKPQLLFYPERLLDLSGEWATVTTEIEISFNMKSKYQDMHRAIEEMHRKNLRYDKSLYLRQACRTSKAIFDTISDIEEEYKVLLQCPDDPKERIDIPKTKEEYIQVTGKSISDEDFDVITVLNGLYSALTSLDAAIEAVGGYDLQQKIYKEN